jgi:hypothetical protein
LGQALVKAGLSPMQQVVGLVRERGVEASSILHPALRRTIKGDSQPSGQRRRPSARPVELSRRSRPAERDREWQSMQDPLSGAYRGDIPRGI